MTRMAPLRTKSMRRRRPRPLIHWQHLLGFCLGLLLPMAWVHHTNSQLSCDPTRFDACR
jgi:hypothetical protein